MPEGGELPEEEIEPAADEGEGALAAEGERAPAEAEQAAAGPQGEPS